MHTYSFDLKQNLHSKLQLKFTFNFIQDKCFIFLIFIRIQIVLHVIQAFSISLTRFPQFILEQKKELNFISFNSKLTYFKLSNGIIHKFLIENKKKELYY
jgi:hypothetical protein